MTWSVKTLCPAFLSAACGTMSTFVSSLLTIRTKLSSQVKINDRFHPPLYLPVDDRLIGYEKDAQGTP